mgnify:CR=1 FL=1
MKHTNENLFIFDMDGTLIDSRTDIAAAVNEVRGHYGLENLSVETVCSYVGNGPDLLIDRALKGISFDPAEALTHFLDVYARGANDKTRPYDGVVKGLEGLMKQGHTLAVSTNKPHDCCLSILKHLGMTRFFSEVLGEGAGYRIKPDPETLLRIMAVTGHGPEKTYMVGDHHTDIESADRAGVKSVFLTGGIGCLDGRKPDFVFDTFADFTSYFI